MWHLLAADDRTMQVALWRTAHYLPRPFARLREMVLPVWMSRSDWKCSPVHKYRLNQSKWTFSTKISEGVRHVFPMVGEWVAQRVYATLCMGPALHSPKAPIATRILSSNAGEPNREWGEPWERGPRTNAKRPRQRAHVPLVSTITIIYKSNWIQ